MAGRGPWLWSAGVHGLALGALFFWWLGAQTPAPGPVRVHWLGSRGAPAAAPGPAARSQVPARPAEAPSDPGTPAAPSSGSPEPWTAPPPSTLASSLEELLGPPAAEKSVDPDPVPLAAQGWSSPENGYVPPELPPPTLVPPASVSWHLTIRVPGAGGYGLVTGLNSGHPALDQWVETYLRSAVFPASLDGQAYDLSWTLNLAVGRPQ